MLIKRGYSAENEMEQTIQAITVLPTFIFIHASLLYQAVAFQSPKLNKIE